MEPPITLVTPSTDVLQGTPALPADVPHPRYLKYVVAAGNLKSLVIGRLGFGFVRKRKRKRLIPIQIHSLGEGREPTKFFAESSNRHPKPAKDAKNTVGENDFPFYARISRAEIFARITSAAVASCH